MNHSEQINELAAALAEAQAEMGGAIKDSANPFFKSKYADLSAVWDACRGPLTKHGLSVAQFPMTEYSGTPEVVDVATRNGETRMVVRVPTVVSVTTRLLHKSGQFIDGTVSTMLPTGDPQAVGSAITYLRRYALQSVAGVAPEDDDGQAASHPPASAKPAALPKPQGYDQWLDDLKATADEGTEAVRAAWLASGKDVRAYLSATSPKELDAIRAKAAKAGVTA
jgi:hypothetical protein